MTVTYIQHVLNGGKFGAFLRLLFMWRGSVYKATGINLVIFICLYTLISLLYRYLLSQEEQYKLGRWSVDCSLCSPVVLVTLLLSIRAPLCLPGQIGRLHTAGLHTGLLRDPGGQQVVGAVQLHRLAGHPRPQPHLIHAGTPGKKILTQTH